MTKLTFYGGVNEIGCNKVLIEDKQTKMFSILGNLSLSVPLLYRLACTKVQIYQLTLKTVTTFEIT
jgi:hypothetical protein